MTRPVTGRKLAKFAFLGGVTYLLLLGQTRLYLDLLQLPRPLAYGIAQVVVFVLNFVLNRHWIFDSAPEHAARQGAKYLLANGAFRLADWSLFNAIEWLTGWPVHVAIFLALAVVFPLKFFTYKVGVFGDRS